MASGSGNQALRRIRTLYALGSVGGLTDGQLVERFLDRDGPDREDAFAELVRRHGPMVLGVCSRMLRGSADAEDAFQATFLVLARRARVVRGDVALKSWLYGVAIRTAKEARRRWARRRATEGGAMDESRAVSAPDESHGELLSLLDEEMGRLPGRYRDPLMLCDLEGVSRHDAARRLGLPEGTLSSRLSRGRSLLRDRLARRGVALGTGMLTSLLSEPTVAAVPEALAASTVRLAAGGATVASPVGLLAHAVERALFPGVKMIPIAIASLATHRAPRALLASVSLAACILVAAFAGRMGVSGGMNPMEPARAKPVAQTTPIPPAGPILDDPLPAGATLRFGTPRFRHTTSIEDFAVSPDGKVAVAASGTLIHGTVRAYDLITGQVRFTFDQSARDVEAVAISPDGKTLAATTSAITTNPVVYLYDMTSGRETARIPYPAANPGSLADLLLYAPGGKHVVVKSADGRAILLLDLARRRVARTYPNDGTVFAAAFSPDGKRLAVGGFDYDKGERFARQWEVDTGRELGRLPSSKGTVWSVAYSPDGATIALGVEARSQLLLMVDAAGGQERREISLPGASNVRSVAFSPDGKTLAASGSPSTRLFDTATGEERLEIDRGAIGLRFSPDGATLAGAVAGTIYRWDAATGRSLIPEGGESPVDQIAVTADGKRIVGRGQDGDAHVWDARTGEHQQRVSVRWQRGLALSPDGRFLAWPVEDETVEFPSVDRPGTTRTGCRLRMMNLSTGDIDERFGSFEGDAHDVFFSPDGQSLVTAERYGRGAAVRVWDVATGKLAHEFPAIWKPEGQVFRSRPSPDGKVLAVLYQGEMRGSFVESEVKLWDIATGKELGGPMPPWFSPEVVAYAPDGKTMAVAPAPFGMTIQFLDVATGRVRGEFRGPRERVTALAFGPDGRLFTGSLDGTVLAWDPRAVGFPPADPE